MKRIAQLSLPLLAAGLLAGLPGGAAAQKPHDEITFPPLNDVELPEIQRVTLDNGIKLYLLEDHDLPLVNASARIRVGEVFDPANKIGLADLTGTVLRSGGTASRTGDEIDELLESIGGSVETWISTTSGGASMSVLKEDVDVGVSVLADILMNPVFAEDKIDLAKIEARSGISRRNDDPLGIAFREFPKLIYGADSPYARHSEYATIDAVTRDDIIAFHEKYFHPNNLMLAVWGDFKTSDMVKRIEKSFGNWEQTEIAFPPLPEVDYEYRETVNLIVKEDATQVPIIMGHVGIQYDNPDYFALLVMNRVFGQGGFSSRMMREVRTRLGLAYATGGGVNANWEYPGTFGVFSLTRSESMMEAIVAMRDVARGMTEALITEDELSQAKEAYLNSFVFNFDTRSEVVNRMMTYDYYGFPEDFLQQTKEKVEQVTREDVLRVAKEYLHVDSMQLMVIGNPDEFDEPLDALGKPVNRIDISIPEPGDEAISEATAEDLSRGIEIMAMAVAACGGEKAAAKVENLHTMADVAVDTPQGKFDIKMNSTTVFPDRAAVVMTLPFGEMTQVVTAHGAWVSGPQGTQDMPSGDAKEARSSLFRDWINLMRGASEGEYQVQYLGTEEIEGKAANVIAVSNAAGTSVKLFMDGSSHMPLRASFRGKTMMGPAAMEEVYSMWREVGGVMVPFKTVTYADGKEFTVARVTSAEANVEVDESLFEKP